MSNAEKPKTPTLDYLRRQPRTSGVSTPADRCVDEHDAIDAWWKEQLAAKDAEIARLSRPRVAPSHKGVTYRDGMWWDADDEGYELASKCIADNSPQCHVAGSKQELLTDDDHAALLALKTEAERVPPTDPVRDAILTALENANRSHAPWVLPMHADALATTLRPLVLKAATVGELAEELRARDEVTHYSHISDSCLRWPGLRRVLVLPTATTNTEGK